MSPVQRLFTACLLALLFGSTPLALEPALAASTDRPALPAQTIATWSPGSPYPTFLRGPLPLPPLTQAATVDDVAAVQEFLAIYGSIFGVSDSGRNLYAVQQEQDALGISHVTLQQHYQGVPVYNALIKVHFSRAANVVLAVGNGYVAGLALPTVTPALNPTVASQVARAFFPAADSNTGPPTLTVYTGAGAQPAAQTARLAWLVEWRHGVDHKLFVVDAHTGKLLDVLERSYTSADKVTYGAPSMRPTQFTTSVIQQFATYSAQNQQTLPGVLMRADDQPSVGDADVDNAHDFARQTFDYYLHTHTRNSYDGNGALITSTVHYGRNMQNAYWNGEQMIYGDGFAVLDVVGHELTHAVTNYTANLEYRWQSGALNESFSDIFGAMIDRTDWLIGEDIAPAAFGQEAFRDMADPTRFNQPAHTDKWVKTCTDEEGVHINSGIFNKAYYNIANAISKEKAERIFYRTLVTYLQANSSFQDARAAVLQATTDLYPTLTLSVTQGFAAVGMTADWQPPVNECTCVALVTAADAQAQGLSILYAVRDQLLASTSTGRYYTDLYYRTTADISILLLADPALRQRTTQIIALVTPGVQALVTTQGNDTLVTAAMVDQMLDYLADLQQAARTANNPQLADTITAEMARIDWPRLPGMTFAEAWAFLNTNPPFRQFLPTVRY